MTDVAADAGTFHAWWRENGHALSWQARPFLARAAWAEGQAACRDRISELERMLEKSTVRLGILRDRDEGCMHRTVRSDHTLTLDEVPDWIAEQRAVLGGTVS